MIIYGVGNEHDSYETHVTPRYSTAVKSVNADYNVVASSHGPALLRLSASLSECWIHFRFAPSSATATASQSFLGLYNSSTKKLALRLVRLDSSGDIHFQYNSSGVTYTTIGKTAGDPSGAQDIDIFFRRGGSGVLRVFINGILRLDTSGSYTTVDTTWDAVLLQGQQVSAQTVAFADLIVADSCLINYSVGTARPDAAGSVNAWDGTYADVLGSAGLIDKYVGIHTDTPGDSYLFGMETFPSLESYQEIKAVSLSTAGSLDAASAVADAELYVRHASTNYTLASLSFSADSVISKNQQILYTNPAGGVWSVSDVGSLEIGVIVS